MITKKTAFYLLIFFSCFSLTASAGQIQGKVTDGSNGSAIAFVSIGVDGSSRGTVSNAEGEYLLDTIGLHKGQVIIFSHVGYATLRFSIADLVADPNVRLVKADVNLAEFEVSSRELKVKEILKLTIEKFDENHQWTSSRNRMYYHKYDRVPFSKDNVLDVKRSDFPTLDEKTIEELKAIVPEQFVEYRDAIVDIYMHEGKSKMKPIEAISMEEGSHDDMIKTFEEKLSGFFKDIEASMKEEDIYYKFRTGIFSTKMDIDAEKDTVKEPFKNDDEHFSMLSNIVKYEITQLIKHNTTMDGENWEFFDKMGNYRFKKVGVTFFNNEPVYHIEFKPKRSGLFEGDMYISTTTFGILQLEYAYAPGKRSENFKLLGIGHEMRFKGSKVIFEKIGDKYQVKYIKSKRKEWAMVNRDFLIMKKKKRFFIDKELNEIKMSMDMQFESNATYELLVMDREPITSSQYSNVEQPKYIEYKREVAYSPEMWKKGTVLVPSAELKDYKRK